MIFFVKIQANILGNFGTDEEVKGALWVFFCKPIACILEISGILSTFLYSQNFRKGDFISYFESGILYIHVCLLAVLFFTALVGAVPHILVCCC